MRPASDSRRQFGTLISQTARQWRRAVDRELQPYGLTEATWLPLLRVARAAKPMHQKDLAESLGLDGSSVVRLLDNLQSMGLIERREATDRRAKAIHLTALGEETVARAEGASRRVGERALAGLHDEEIVRTFAILDQICASLVPAGGERAA